MTDHIEVHGLRIGFRRAGQGPVVLLLHGAFCDSRVWRTQLEDLAGQFTLVAWDAPGCGGSSDPPEDFRLPGYADCLAGFITALDLGRPHVVGHSFGGGLALELYRRHPQLPRSLVLAAGYAGWAGSLPGHEVRARLELTLRQADQLPMTLTTDSIPGLFAPGAAPEPVAELAAIMSDTRPIAARVMARAFAEADLRGVLPGIKVPTLLLYGDADERAPRPVWTALHAQIPGSVLKLLPERGHEAFLEAPGEFNTALRRFLHATS